MGCDIHLHIEVKIDGEWEHYGAPRCDRRYGFFGKMAGVRDSVQSPIVEPRGLPYDVSAITELSFRYWGSVGHTHSWLNSREVSILGAWALETHPDEFCPLEKWLGCFLFGNGFDPNYESHWPDGVEDFRFVFWFDS